MDEPNFTLELNTDLEKTFEDGLAKPWEQPGNEPLDQELIETLAAERAIDEELDGEGRAWEELL